MFSARKIRLEETSVAEQLRSRRQSLGLTLADAAKKLTINQKYLQALERGDYDQLPKGVYGQNFLREYARFLGFDYQALAKQFLEDKKLSNGKDSQKFFREQTKRPNYLALGIVLRNLLIGAAVVIALVYLGGLVRNIFAAPELIINSPAQNLKINQSWLNVSGQTAPESEVAIANVFVVVDKQGNFSQVINLKPGLNVITITAKKKNSQTATVVRQILYENK